MEGLKLIEEDKDGDALVEGVREAESLCESVSEALFVVETEPLLEIELDWESVTEGVAVAEMEGERLPLQDRDAVRLGLPVVEPVTDAVCVAVAVRLGVGRVEGVSMGDKRSDATKVDRVMKEVLEMVE